MSKKGYVDENSTQIRLKEKLVAAAAQAEREEALLGSKAGRDRDARDRAKRPASRATKAKEAISGNDDRNCSK